MATVTQITTGSNHDLQMGISERTTPPTTLTRHFMRDQELATNGRFSQNAVLALLDLIVSVVSQKIRVPPQHGWSCRRTAAQKSLDIITLQYHIQMP